MDEVDCSWHWWLVQNIPSWCCEIKTRHLARKHITNCSILLAETGTFKAEHVSREIGVLEVDRVGECPSLLLEIITWKKKACSSWMMLMLRMQQHASLVTSKIKHVGMNQLRNKIQRCQRATRASCVMLCRDNFLQMLHVQHVAL